MLTITHRDADDTVSMYDADKIIIREKAEPELLYGFPGVHLIKMREGSEHWFIPFVKAGDLPDVPGAVGAPKNHIYVMNEAGKTVGSYSLYR